MPRWLAVKGFTCLEVLLQWERGNDSRNFEGVKGCLKSESHSLLVVFKKFSEFGPSRLHFGEADILGIPDRPTIFA
jgi:hypothetical protein